MASYVYGHSMGVTSNMYRMKRTTYMRCLRPSTLAKSAMEYHHRDPTRLLDELVHVVMELCGGVVECAFDVAADVVVVADVDENVVLAGPFV